MHPASCRCNECTACSACGDRFETKRGLTIHFTRLHRDKIKEPESLQPAQKKGYRKRSLTNANKSPSRPVNIDKVARYFNSSNSSNATSYHLHESKSSTFPSSSSSSPSIAIKEEAIFACEHDGPWCGEFNTASELDLHTKLFHSEYKARECGRCRLRCFDMRRYNTHYCLGHVPPQPRNHFDLTPSDDYRKTGNDSILDQLVQSDTDESHDVNSNNFIIDDIQSLRCSFEGPYCGAFDTPDELNQHKKLYHSRYLAEECQRCLMRFEDGQDRRQHTKECTRQVPRLMNSSTVDEGTSGLLVAHHSTRRSVQRSSIDLSLFE